MEYDKNNIFYKIINKTLPAEIIYEDDSILAFKDKFPKAKNHILVIPKIYVINYSDFIQYAVNNKNLDIISDFFMKVNKVAEILKLKSFKILTNNGKDSGQEVMHFHIHILSDH